MKRAIVALLVACSPAAPVVQAPSPTFDAGSEDATMKNPPAVTSSNARVVLTANKDAFFLGENVLVHYCVENTSKAPITIDVGGDYRGSSRSLRFKVTVTGEDGKSIDDPDPHPYNLGGMSYSPKLAPGESWCQSLPLMRYARIERAGTYTVKVTHDLGWRDETPPVGERKVRFTEPTDLQALGVVNAMRAMPTDPNTSAGKKSVDYQDFSTLAHPAYLPHLEKLAQSAFLPAISGIAMMPTSDATRALLTLAAHGNPDVRRAANEAISMRLPDPALQGQLGARNPFFNEIPDLRKYLVAKSWQPQFESDVRRLARTLLASGLEEDQRSGAFFLEAIGDASDAADLANALTVAIEKTKTQARETNVYPVPRGACQELLRAAEMLVMRGYVPSSTKTTGDLAMWLVAVGRAKPAGWEATMKGALAHSIPYVREIALARLPYDPKFDADIETNLSHADVDVKIAAVHHVENHKIAKLGPKVLAILSTAKEEWLLRGASNALYNIGMRAKMYDALAARLGEPALGNQMLSMLSDVFESNGRGSQDAKPEVIKALQPKWQAFLKAHATEIESKGRLSLDVVRMRADEPAPKDLFPAGWTFHRTGKPDWP